MTYKIIHGDCFEELKNLPDHSVDSVVTDPPYGLSKEPNIREVLEKWLAGEDYHHRGGGFMGKTWDSFVPGPAIWREVYRVLKPGGHALVFAGTRTQDLMTISLRLAGFEVRDVIEWLYFQGFPKSLDVSKAFDKRAGVEREVIGTKYTTPDIRGNSYDQVEKTSQRERLSVDITAPATDLAKKWDGWGTALKPAHEPIILVRKPLDGTVADNVERWGTGALNIDGCRIGDKGGTKRSHQAEYPKTEGGKEDRSQHWARVGHNVMSIGKGRFPANCVTTEPDAFYSTYFNVAPPDLCKKASKRDRDSDWRGEEIALEERRAGGMKATIDGSMLTGSGNERKTVYRNTHPTVKPTDLMAWLVRLVTPPGGIVLDPFAGSGSTLVAARREGFGFIGIEREQEYIEIAKARAGV